MYGPLPKQPKFTTVAVPIEAIRHETQATITATPDIYFTANPTLPSLPIPPFPNEESPTPPSSPLMSYVAAVCVSKRLGTLPWVREVVLVTDLRNPAVPHASGRSSDCTESEGTA